MLLVFSVGVCSAYSPGDPEFRGFWVDAWGVGALDQSQVDNLLGVPGTPQRGQIRDANCNAIVLQVRRNCDANYQSTLGEPFMTGISPADFDALQAVIDAAHDTTDGKKRVEVHAWLVAFRTSGGQVYLQHVDPPTGSLIQYDNYWPSRDIAGAEVGDKAFDPGHPLAADYTVNVALDIVQNYEVDAIHYDYIRFTAGNQGYNPTSLARYNDRYGLTGQPAANDEQWRQWRRDQVTAVVRKTYAKIQAIKPKVQLTGSFVTWNPSPVSSTREAFMATRPYYDVYSDWDGWVQEGILDAAIPMTYYNWASLPNDYIRWMNFMKDRSGDRFMYIGPGIYLNSLNNAILELNMTRSASPAGNVAHGFCGYSYRVPYDGGVWSGFATRLKNEVTPIWADIPAMHWKTAPSKGHISGTVTIAGSSRWLDGATVQVTGPEERSMLTDGTGFYAFIDLTPGTYNITVSKAGSATVQRQVVVGIGEVNGNMYINDFVVGSSPTIYDVAVIDITDTTATIAWKTDLPSSSQVQYGLDDTYGQITAIDPAMSETHVVTITGLVPHTVYHFSAVSGNEIGFRASPDYVFTSGSRLLQVVSVPEDGGAIYGAGWYAQGAPVTIYADIGSGFFFQGWSTTTSPSGIISTANPYEFEMPSTAVTLYAIFQSSVGDIIVESMPGGQNFNWYQDFNFANSTAKSGAPGCTPGIGSRYSVITSDIASRYTLYQPAIPVDGTYEVWATWGTSSNGGSSIRHTVAHRDGSYTKVFNQASNGNKWNHVGTFPFVTGPAGSQYAELKQWVSAAQSGKRIMGDAVKWVFVAPFKAINPSPANNAVEVSPSNEGLSWEPGGTTGAYDVYFGTNPSEMEKVSSMQTSTNYSLDVLSSTTTYYWRVDSFCLGKLVTGDTWKFTTSAVAPSISNIEVIDATAEDAVVTWETDQPSTSQVEYGTDSNYGALTPKDTNLKKIHSVTLTGLSHSTVYHFRVISANSLNMTTNSDDRSFATRPESPTKIVDNPQGEADGTWRAMTDVGGWPETSSQYVYAENKLSVTTATFKWTPNISVSGNYNVYCWYKAGADRTTSARYTVAYDDGQLAVSVVNQQSNGSQWVPIALNKRFNKGSSGYVILTNKTGETDGARKVIADAIMFEYIDSEAADLEVPANLTATAVSTTGIDLVWNAVVGNDAFQGYKVFSNNQVTGITPDANFAARGLVPNTEYGYQVRSYDASGNESELCAEVKRHTLSPPTTTAHITCNRNIGATYPTPEFEFSNTGFGPGKVSTYRYVWNNQPSHTWTDAEAQWTNTDLIVNATNSQPWYFHVKGYNGDGVTSGSVVLGPYYVGGTAVQSIAQATNYPDGTVVSMAQFMTISAVFSDRFYIQEDSRIRGLRCEGSTLLPVGTRVKVIGTLATSDSERYLSNPIVVESIPGAAPRPLMMRTNAAGGKSPDQHTVGFSNTDQLFNVGMLIRVAGSVSAPGAGYFAVSDGTGGSILVRSSKSVSAGAFAGATGIVVVRDGQCELWTRSADDVVIYSP